MCVYCMSYYGITKYSYDKAKGLNLSIKVNENKNKK